MKNVKLWVLFLDGSTSITWHISVAAASAYYEQNFRYGDKTVEDYEIEN